MNSMYVSSTVLYTLALHGQTGPEFIKKRLWQCYNGVLILAALVKGLAALVAFLGANTGIAATVGMCASERRQFVEYSTEA